MIAFSAQMVESCTPTVISKLGYFTVFFTAEVDQVNLVLYNQMHVDPSSGAGKKGTWQLGGVDSGATANRRQSETSSSSSTN